MKTAQEFLSEFVRDIVRHPGERPELIAGWAKHMEARENITHVKVTHYGIDYAKIEIANQEFEVPVALAKAIEGSIESAPVL